MSDEAFSCSSLNETVGKDFDLNKMLFARQQAVNAVNQIAESLKVGMNEADARLMADDLLLNKFGATRLWHPTKIRFANNTLKSFREVSDDSIILNEDDIFFIDIGAVWDGHEGDAGDTFSWGNNIAKQECCHAVKKIFQLVASHWRETGISGRRLYDYANQCAIDLGWHLNLSMKGHRLSDFPHAIYKAGSLADFDDCPSVGLWVLEIQIAHPTLPFGGFYEDLLLEG